MNTIDQYLRDLDLSLGAHGRQRVRILGEVRDHLLEAVTEETNSGASKDEATLRALERFGPARQLADTFREEVLAAQTMSLSRWLLGAFAPLLVLLAAAFLVGLSVLSRERDVEYFRGMFGGTFHYYSWLGFSLPPRRLSIELAVSAGCFVLALLIVLAAFLLARSKRRSALGVAGASLAVLLVSLCAQVAFAAEWHSYHQPNQLWLIAAIMLEALVVLRLLTLLARPLHGTVAPRYAPLAQTWTVSLALVAMLAASGSWSYFGSNETCLSRCAQSYPRIQSWLSSVDVSFSSNPRSIGPAAVALSGRKLAFAAAVYKPGLATSSRSGADRPIAQLVLWQIEWRAGALGPCGRWKSGLTIGLSADIVEGCGLYPASDQSAYVGMGPLSDRPAGVVETHLPGIAPGPVALAYSSGHQLELAYSTGRGVAVRDVSGRRRGNLAIAGAVVIRLAGLSDGGLALAAIVRGGGASRLFLARSKGGNGGMPIPVAAVSTDRLQLYPYEGVVALLYQRNDRRFVIELRTRTLALRKRVVFTGVSSAVLGTLRNGKLALATQRLAASGAMQFEIFELHSAAWVRVAQTRISDPVLTFGSESGQLLGVTQTGRTVRAVISATSPNARNQSHVLAVFGQRVFNDPGENLVSSWPRLAVVTATRGGMPSFSPSRWRFRWKYFDVKIIQPSEAQLLKMGSRW